MKPTRRTIEKIKKDYYDGLNTNQLCEKYNMQKYDLEKILDRPQFRNHTFNGVKYKRCHNCNIWKPITEYQSAGYCPTGTKQYKSKCRYCNNIIYRNRYKLGLIDTERLKAYNKKYREENKYKYSAEARRLRHIANGTREEYLKKQRLAQRKHREKKRLEKIKAKRLLNN